MTLRSGWPGLGASRRPVTTVAGEACSHQRTRLTRKFPLEREFKQFLYSIAKQKRGLRPNDMTRRSVLAVWRQGSCLFTIGNAVSPKTDRGRETKPVNMPDLWGRAGRDEHEAVGVISIGRRCQPT